MFDADASSTIFTPSRAPKYHIASTSSCSERTFASASSVAGDDVDDAGRHVGRFENAIEIRRGERMRLRRNDDDGVAGRDRRRDERDEAEQRDARRGRRCR